MGCYTNQSVKVKCPLYEGFVRSKNEKISGIQCACVDPGIGASTIVRFHGFNETMKHKRTHCDSLDGYKKCPYYMLYEKDQP